MYLAMAVFVKHIDKLFDSFNSMKCAATGNTMPYPLCGNSLHIGQ
jgi:hypothetical protein